MEDPISYATDVRANAQTQARELLKGKCFDSMFVREVELVQASNILLENVPIGAAMGRVDVRVTLVGRALGAGDLIPCMEVLSAEGVVIGKSGVPFPIISTLLMPNEAIKVGSRLPVRVRDCKHPPRRTTAVAAVELLVRNTDVTWNV
ncbi:MAG: hypothetical protein P1U53_15535, partial [Sulfitobacter sp.]|nr:hypothetical protein [Sulfitobacter sp.]